MKKSVIAVFVSAVVFLMSFSGCGDSGNSQNGGESNNQTSLIVYQTPETKSLAVDGSVTIDVNKSLEKMNYVIMEVKNSVNVTGSFNYVSETDANKQVSEEFYIPASPNGVVFKQFLDAFRDNGCGNFDKLLKSVTFKNVSKQAGEVTLSKITVNDRVIPEFEKEVYIQDDYLKVGADLAQGGILTYLTRLDFEGETIDEVIRDENVYIGVDAKSDCEEYLSQDKDGNPVPVNLINTYDPGRQFQQSYYADVGYETDRVSQDDPRYYTNKVNADANGLSKYSGNGYTRAWCTTARTAHFWPYNPVQGGDCHHNPSQIIDYEVTEDTIYVKTRAMDWAHNNRTTRSYYENWYTIEDGLLMVTNHFVNWEGFYDEEGDPIMSRTNELPAAFVVHPFNNYVVYNGSNPWTEEDSFLRVHEMTENAASGSHKVEVHKEDWFAWLNDEDFGVGVYVPKSGTFASGRNSTSSINSSKNNTALQAPCTDPNWLQFNKADPTSVYTSCYAFNSCYTAPVWNLTMKDYVPMVYGYAVAVDYLDAFRKDFKRLYDNNKIDNSGFDAWR